MRLTNPKAALVGGLLILSLSAFAEESKIQVEEPSRLRLFGRGGLAMGGNSIVSGSYTDNTTWDIRAGAGAIFAIGGEFQLTYQWSIQATKGYQREKTNATDAEVKLTRAPQEVLVFYEVAPQWKLGAGLRQDKNIGMTWYKDGGSSGSTKFEDTNGTVLEAQYLFTPRDKKSQRSLQAGLSLRVVRQDLKNNDWQKTYNANQVGLSVFFYY